MSRLEHLFNLTMMDDSCMRPDDVIRCYRLYGTDDRVTVERVLFSSLASKSFLCSCLFIHSLMSQAIFDPYDVSFNDVL